MFFPCGERDAGRKKLPRSPILHDLSSLRLSLLATRHSPLATRRESLLAIHRALLTGCSLLFSLLFSAAPFVARCRAFEHPCNFPVALSEQPLCPLCRGRDDVGNSDGWRESADTLDVSAVKLTDSRCFSYSGFTRFISIYRIYRTETERGGCITGAGRIASGKMSQRAVRARRGTKRHRDASASRRVEHRLV